VTPTEPPEHEQPPTGFPEPPGEDDPGDHSHDRDPHHALNFPASDPDPTEWPDPYDNRPDPRDPPDPDEELFGEDAHPASGATSTSDPRHQQDDPETPNWKAPDRDNLDE
jgi:hypothetical protein